jgi:hypothetical protein
MVQPLAAAADTKHSTLSGKTPGVEELHFAVLKGWVTPADAAIADSYMAARYKLISNFDGYV